MIMSTTATTVATTETDDEGRLDVSLLRELARQNLVDILNSVNGPKTFVLDPTLSTALSLLAEISLLKNHGVSKIYWLEPTPVTAPTKSLFYLLRPTIPNIKLVASHIKGHQQSNADYSYKLVFVPRSSTLTDSILESEGIRGSVDVVSWDMGFIPLEPDLVSLEWDNAFKELWVDEDPTPLHSALNPLQIIHRLFGSIPRVIGKGSYAHRLAKMFKSHLQSSNDIDPSASTRTSFSNTSSSGEIDSLIVIDRKVDMITPLLTQLTYEGLIDEVLTIRNSHVEIPASLLATPNAQPAAPSAPAVTVSTSADKPKKHQLSSSSDPLLSSLRDLNFSSIGRQLSRIAHRLEQDYKSRHKAQTVQQLKEFVGKMGGLQSEAHSLKLHTGITEILNPYTQTEVFNTSLEIQQNLLASYSSTAQLNSIENLISAGAPLNTILRLLCLASITTGGIKQKTLEGLKREILQTYGYHELPTLLALGSPPLNLILTSPRPQNAPPLYPHTQLRKFFRLLIDAEDILTVASGDDRNQDEPDISYVYSGWAPLSVRLVQCITQKGGVYANPNTQSRRKQQHQKSASFGATEQVSQSQETSSLGKTPAQTISGWKGFEEAVELVPGDTFDIPLSERRTSNGGLHQGRSSVTTSVLFFLGGITYTEIAAIRWMARQQTGRKYLIATTGIISGNSIMDGIGGNKPNNA